MGERPLLYFALGILVTTSIGATMNLRSDGIEFPDGTVQTSADTRRAFYLADDPTLLWTGATARDACDGGFHMASLWEILDPADLRYISDDELTAGHFAKRTSDSGVGPPSGEAGWIRTGYLNDSSSNAGWGNCNTWSQTSGNGSRAALNFCWENDAICDVTPDTKNQAARWWLTVPLACNLATKVWCVQD
jgi:hypothetical protein